MRTHKLRLWNQNIRGKKKEKKKKKEEDRFENDNRDVCGKVSSPLFWTFVTRG